MKCLNQTTQQIANKIDSQKFLSKVQNYPKVESIFPDFVIFLKKIVKMEMIFKSDSTTHNCKPSQNWDIKSNSQILYSQWRVLEQTTQNGCNVNLWKWSVCRTATVQLWIGSEKRGVGSTSFREEKGKEIEKCVGELRLSFKLLPFVPKMV